MQNFSRRYQDDRFFPYIRVVSAEKNVCECEASFRNRSPAMTSMEFDSTNNSHGRDIYTHPVCRSLVIGYLLSRPWAAFPSLAREMQIFAWIDFWHVEVNRQRIDFLFMSRNNSPLIDDLERSSQVSHVWWKILTIKSYRDKARQSISAVHKREYIVRRIVLIVTFGAFDTKKADKGNKHGNQVNMT